jgi:hypothetical protein
MSSAISFLKKYNLQYVEIENMMYVNVCNKLIYDSECVLPYLYLCTHISFKLHNITIPIQDDCLFLSIDFF